MQPKTKLALLGAVLAGMAAVWLAVGNHGAANVTYSQFLDRVRAGQIDNVVVMSGRPGAVRAVGRLQDGSTVRTALPADYRDALQAMQTQRVNVEIRDAAPGPLVKSAPFLVLLGVWVCLMLLKGPKGPWRTLPRIFATRRGRRAC